MSQRRKIVINTRKHKKSNPAVYSSNLVDFINVSYLSKIFENKDFVTEIESILNDKINGGKNPNIIIVDWDNKKNIYINVCRLAVENEKLGSSRHFCKRTNNDTSLYDFLHISFHLSRGKTPSHIKALSSDPYNIMIGKVDGKFEIISQREKSKKFAVEAVEGFGKEMFGTEGISCLFTPIATILDRIETETKNIKGGNGENILKPIMVNNVTTELHDILFSNLYITLMIIVQIALNYNYDNIFGNIISISENIDFNEIKTSSLYQISKRVYDTIEILDIIPQQIEFDEVSNILSYINMNIEYPSGKEQKSLQPTMSKEIVYTSEDFKEIQPIDISPKSKINELAQLLPERDKKSEMSLPTGGYKLYKKYVNNKQSYLLLKKSLHANK